MKRILVTGATGNIGYEVIQYLTKTQSEIEIIAGVRDTEKAKAKFINNSKLLYRHFDFENPQTFANSFHQVDVLFLLRPPHISQIDKIFRPLLTSAKDNGISRIVFLSVQGAEKSKVIPHNKIERSIHELNFQSIFVRPSYFMQNLTTTLLPEVHKNKSITLPSGKAKFNWVDVKNIGEACAVLILEFENYKNAPYEITGSENKNFDEVTEMISEITGEPIQFHSMNPFSFYLKKFNEGIKSDFALVMTILHFLPRFQREPSISDSYLKLTGKHPTTIRDFILRVKKQLLSSHHNR